MPTFWKRALSLLSRSRLERELTEEVEAHLQMRADELAGQGLSDADARAAARREFGGVEQMKEAYRDRRGVPPLEILAKDVRYAVRGLRRSPAFTTAAALSLALGIGANTAIFSFVNALMLRLLPVREPEQLVTIYRSGGWGQGYSSYPLYLMFRAHPELFEGVLARSSANKVRFDSGKSSRAEFAMEEFVSGNYFEVLGVQPVLGRLFTDEDNRTPHAHPYAVLNYDFWRSRFALDPGVLGRSLTLDGQPLTVVGVAAPAFHGVEVEHRPDVWVPAMMFSGDINQVGMHWVWIMARRRPGVPKATLQAAANTIMQQYLATNYGSHRDSAFRAFAMSQKIEVRDGRSGISMLRDSFSKPLAILMAAVGLVLLIACANVANLLIARGAARSREMALRFALGASRARIVGQHFIESLLLALLGSILGLAFALWGQRYMLWFLPPGAGESFDISPDVPVLVFTAGISALSAILFGLMPALRSAMVDPAPALKQGARTSVSGSRARLRKTLVVVQVAFSVVLVAGATLFARSLATLRSIHPGFKPQNVVTFSLDCPPSWKAADKEKFRERLRAAVTALPGVKSVSYGLPGPYGRGMWSAGIRVPGSARTAKEGVQVAQQGIGPAYFETIGMRPLRGREFDAADFRSDRKIAVVNEAFLHEFLPEVRDGVGRVLSFDDSKPEGGEPTYIVGVVRDILHKGLKAKAEPTVYVPFRAAEATYDPVLAASARIPPDALLNMIRAGLSRLDPEVAMIEPRSLSGMIDDSIYLDRLTATLSGFFGMLALLLAAVGVYGVVAYGVAQRVREIGVRIAMGAEPQSIEWMILGDGMRLVTLGFLLGLPLAVAAARLTTALLFGIKPGDPLSLAVTVAVLFGIGALAAWLPARRAASIDPMSALRQE
ncbi:MAG: ABC transporter permease [Bryobacteraceae bacterium]